MRQSLIDICMIAIFFMLSTVAASASQPIILYSGTHYIPHLIDNSLRSELNSANPDNSIVADDNFKKKNIDFELAKIKNWNICDKIDKYDNVINLAIIITRADDAEQTIKEYTRHDFTVGVTLVLYSISEGHDTKLNLYYTRFQLAQALVYKKNSQLSLNEKKESLVKCLAAAIHAVLEDGAKEYVPRSDAEGISKANADSTHSFQVDKFIISKNCKFADAFSNDDYGKQFRQWIHDSISRTHKVNLLPPFSLLEKEQLDALVEYNNIMRVGTKPDVNRSNKKVAYLVESSIPDYYIRAIFSKGNIVTIKEVNDRRANLYSAYLLGGVLERDNPKDVIIKVKHDDSVQGERFNYAEIEDRQFLLDAINKASLKLGDTLADAIIAANLSK